MLVSRYRISSTRAAVLVSKMACFGANVRNALRRSSDLRFDKPHPSAFSQRCIDGCGSVCCGDNGFACDALHNRTLVSQPYYHTGVFRSVRSRILLGRHTLRLVLACTWNCLGRDPGRDADREILCVGDHANERWVFLSLTRSHRRRQIGVQPISSNVAPVTAFRETQTRNDASVDVNATASLLLLCEARLNDERPAAQADRRSAEFFEDRLRRELRRPHCSNSSARFWLCC